MFKKVVIANRALVASRIVRTLKRMGVATVAVHSEADRDLPFVAEADEAYCIGPAPAKQSYLNVDAVMDVVVKTKADGLHPGYGFLSENCDFAGRVEAIGCRFIGPHPDHVHAMGDKVRARIKAAEAGVPVLGASPPIAPDDPALADIAARVGYPLLVKAAAGGGGIGMQKVMDAGQLAAAVKKTRDLSERAFGDGAVYLERYLIEPRHVEFQMIGDGKGAVRAIFERDCSIQRRYQKLIEETPAPGVGGKAEAMAARLEKTLAGWNYDSLGTVETLMDANGDFYFLEMNTRLQVEHGVTEMTTGLDLVNIQMRIAAGASLSEVLPPTVARHGHSIEARVYAEDPVRFLPSPGTLSVFRPPVMGGVRVEVATAEGATVTPYYDPLLALVMAWGKDRTEATRRLDDALGAFSVEGVKTNIPFLRRVLASEDFIVGRHHTAFAEAFAKAA